MFNDFVVHEVVLYLAGQKKTLTKGHRYRATYRSGKILEFTFQEAYKKDKHNVHIIDVWNVTQNHSGGRYGFCSECTDDWKELEELPM